uniref:Prefoldin subunit 1 n=1 Tax=Eutreptiella gymnastica TaxID=73025 RepID=A0A7S1J6X9_9EUGL|mmetsp:Transcript_71981/g.126850  ORF Transcript_71981/g.126850 Transcript_71981/m.126850 type:complete len:133 (+) Transcript_71981:32-430(+)
MPIDQAQVKEMEAGIMDAQEKVINARQSCNQVNTQIAIMEREKKRVDITLRELDTAGERPSYKSIGRAFVLTSVPQLKEALKEKDVACDAEIVSLKERKITVEKSAEDAENYFRRQFKQYQEAQAEIKAAGK